ncbi:glycosyltransferase family 2 protein [Streptococcus suis]
MTDLISVVVTCYNHEKYIEQCLVSIFEQTYKNIELFIINDGSSDNSLSIIETTIEHSPFTVTRLINQENKGIVVSRNIGLENIHGKYVLFVDSDNYLPENFIENLYHTAESTDGDIIPTNLVNPDTGQIFLETREFDLQEFLIGNFIDMCSLIRTSIIGETQFDIELNRKKLVDYDFFLNLVINNNAKVVPNYDTFVYYRVLDDSMSDRDNIYKYYQVYTYLLEKYSDRYPYEIQNAYKWHLNRFISLDAHSRNANQYLTVYFLVDGEYDEENAFRKEIKLRDSVEIEIPTGVETIRVDPSEVPNYFSKIQLISRSYNTEIEPIWTNAAVIDGNYYFTDQDPQIIYNLKNSENRKVTFSYELINTLNLTNNFLFSNKIINQLSELSSKATRYDALSMKYEHQVKEIENLTTLYNSVVNSRRWIIPSKIIDFFRRKK